MYQPTQRTAVRRLRERGRYDRETVHAILDEGFVCHVGFVDGDQPYVLPTLYARVGETLYLHGASGGRMLRALTRGVPVCLTVTLVDGLVLARSAFHHSVNYRSVVVLGRPRAVTDLQERELAFRAIVEHAVPGRWAHVRPPSRKESAATALAALPLDEVSAKVRSGPVKDEEGDYELPVWAGVLPLRLVTGEPEPDGRLDPAVPAPAHVTAWRRPSPPGAA